MTAALSGTLYMLDAHFMYVGPLVASAAHAHHAGQIMWAPGGVRLRNGDVAAREATLAIVPPRQIHAHGTADLAAMLWVDGDDDAWETGHSQYDVPQAELAALGRLATEPTLSEARVLAKQLLRLLTLERPHVQRVTRRHPAVRRMRTLLDEASVASSREVNLAQLARRAGLSARQLRHVFVRDTGVNARAYLRWRRLRRAVASIQDGATLTHAAMQAGFADAAHFSRYFRCQFGMSPRQAFSSMQFGS